MTQAAQLIEQASTQPPQDFRQVLMESRQRWRQFGALATDLAFETDAEGRFTFLAPEIVLGWPASHLIHQPAKTLLTNVAAPDPFRCTLPVRRRQTWLRTESGAPLCMALSITPMLDDDGRPCGVRGIGVNVTEQQRAEAASASALRRAEVLDHVLSQMRQEVMAPKMMSAVLDAIPRALGCAGAAVLDLVNIETTSILHQAGTCLLPRQLAECLPQLAASDDSTQTFELEDATIVLACPCSTRFGDRAAMLTWRAPPARPWNSDDRLLAGSVTGVVRIVLEHEAIQRELARQARTDPLTGLLNRRAFIEEAGRRLDRLEKERAPGTLMFLDLDRLKQLNDHHGHDAGDSALILTAALLHRTFRPADLVARLGGDEFAVWLDGADSLTAAERAEELRLATPAELAHLTAGDPPMGMSIGIATREPGSDEMLEQVIQRADQAMYQVKRSGRGHWRVSHLAEVP